MTIEKIKSLLDQVSVHNGRNIKSTIENSCQGELIEIIWQDNFTKIISSKSGIKKALVQGLEKELAIQIWTEVISPQREVQQAAIAREEIKKVDRLPLNAKLHLLKTNSLINNIQLAFSDPKDYVEFDTDKFIWMKSVQIQDEIRRSIMNHIVINPSKAKSLYEKLWLHLSLDSTEDIKRIFADAKTHTYTRSIKPWSFKEKTTPRITYIQWYPMLFGKNLLHVEHGNNTTRSEKSKYNIDTSAKIFDDFYSLVRAHSHIQDSEQDGIESLMQLNTLFAQANSIVKNKNNRQELELLIQDIIAHLTTKKDSNITKARKQDLEHILQTHHIIQNENKLIAAWTKIRKRMTSQQEIKNTVALQQNALHEDLAQQEIYARQLIVKLQWHIDTFNTKNRSARKLAQSYQEKLYAKPFFDLHDHIIQLEDQAKLQKWIPYTLKTKIATDLLIQRAYITILFLYNHHAATGTILPEKWFDSILKDLEHNDLDQQDKETYLSVYIDSIQKIKHAAFEKESFADIVRKVKTHTQQNWKSLLNT